MKNAAKFTVAVLLAPAVAFAFISAGKMIFNFALSSELVIYFLGGALLYIGVHFSIFNFSRAYVFAHEIMHAVSALFFGFKVHSIKVKKKSGHVKLSDHNEAVVLAPYIVPFYFVIAAIVFYILFRSGYNSTLYQHLYAGALGFLWGFHIVHTIKTITETSQSDLKVAGGTVFSLVIILALNLLLVFLMLAFLFPQAAPFWAVLKEIYFNTLNFWKKVLNYIYSAVVHLFKL